MYRATQVVWYITGIIETLLGLRFILRLIGANPGAGFVDAVYTITAPLVQPFNNIVRNASTGGSVFDWNTLIAMIVYWLLAWAIVRLFFIGRPVSEDEAKTEIYRDNDEVL
ncbi:MAG: YggT family protein [Candidatus Doudnabacteria bacterium]|nr:YggT family protein [Candidatus Doudnabacteria bacterium]